MSENWTSEEIAIGETHRHRIKDIIYVDEGPHHKLEILETESYGRGLFLDGRIQHLEQDEYIYSESIVHPVTTMQNGENMKVLVVGGGPGGAIRELLKYDTVETITQVEIDKSIVDLSKKYFPHISAGYHDNERVNIVITDIKGYAAVCKEKYDLIIYDVSEPLDGSPAESLFSTELLSKIKGLLTQSGAFVTWGGSVGPCSSHLTHQIYNAINQLYQYCEGYLCHTQSYGTAWLTVVGSMTDLAPLSQHPDEIDDYLNKHVKGELKLYDGVTHQHMFHLPKDVRTAIAADIPNNAEIKLTLSTTSEALEEC
jgi:spermidine synthase